MVRARKRLARSRGSDHDDIALLDLHARLVLGLLQALVMDYRRPRPMIAWPRPAR